MGSSQSVEVPNEDEDEDEDEDEEEEEEEEEGDDDDDDREVDLRRRRLSSETHLLVKKVLEQEPEMLPCYASASPLSPQLSSLGTPRLGPSIKVWDPYNVLAPPPPLPPPPSVFSNSGMDDDRTVTTTEVYLISHGECDLNLRPDLVSGRSGDAALTLNGKRQARALAVFLNSQCVRFNAVYCSPLDRARATAVSVCQDMNFAKEQIQSSEALIEMSHGQWEGCPRSEIFTPEILSLIERFRPDFSSPAGESLRQVEFRMIQFLNGVVLALPEKIRSNFSSPHPIENQGFPHSSHSLTNSLVDRDASSPTQTQWDMLHRPRQGLTRKKSGKSRLQYVTTTGNHEAEDEFSPWDANHLSAHHNMNNSSTSAIGIFTHAVPIKCLLTGLLECSPVASNKICIDDSSVTVLQHSWRTGWQIKRLNDTAHLRLL